jgi:glycosyltransferase involved in cell wall biosynthesis
MISSDDTINSQSRPTVQTDLKVSVITVSLNNERTIARTLRSVAMQSYKSVEHILIDGFSTDGTLNVVANTPNRVAVLLSEKDQGIYDAMNKGLAQVSGDIVCFLNADDQYSSANVLSLVASRIREHSLDALIGDVGYFLSKDPSHLVRRYRSSRFNPDRLAWGWMPAHPALFLHRRVIERVGKFRTDYRIAGDFEFIIRVFHRQAVRYEIIPEILVHMQSGGASTGGWRSKVLLNKEVLRACRENGLNTHMLKILSKYPAKLLEMLRL